ncbi:hypothetical protein WJX73_000433 [Symbiochloris irregularis]|uniref:Elongator complex protein 5 n=1 Tax=Symbiochloris irregularis TaxID=706552 RepID=A0AAW1NN67_9CHLO
MLPCLLRACTGQPKVVLLSTTRPYNHYRAALRRMGVKLDAMVQQGHAVFIEPPLPEPGGLRQLYTTILQALQKIWTENCAQPLILCIDTLTDLRAQEAGQQVWMQFLLQLRGLAHLLEGGVCLMLLVHTDIEGDAVWNCWLQHSAQVVWEVQALESGHSAAITGQVVCKLQCLSLQPGLIPSSASVPLHYGKTFNYRLSDASVDIFELG